MVLMACPLRVIKLQIWLHCLFSSNTRKIFSAFIADVNDLILALYARRCEAHVWRYYLFAVVFSMLQQIRAVLMPLYLHSGKKILRLCSHRLMIAYRKREAIGSPWFPPFLLGHNSQTAARCNVKRASSIRTQCEAGLLVDCWPVCSCV